LICLDSFIVVLVAFLVLYAGYRWLRPVMSDSKRLSFAAAILGGIIGGLVGLWWGVGPRLGYLSIPIAVAGAVLLVLVVGFAPFVRIMFVKEPLSRR
jgi:hypothetical protein